MEPELDRTVADTITGVTAPETSEGMMVQAEQIAFRKDPAYAKVVVSNVLAGSLIGKNGQNITKLRTQTGASMAITSCAVNANHYASREMGMTGLQYPDRVAKISGTLSQVQAAVKAILEFIFSSNSKGADERAVDNPFTLRFLMPNSSVTILIGKAGNHINELRALSGAKIHVSAKDQCIYGTNLSDPDQMIPEREVIITGDFNQVTKAATAVCKVIQEDPFLAESMSISYDSFVKAIAPHPAATPQGYPMQQTNQMPHAPNMMNNMFMGPMVQQQQQNYGKTNMGVAPPVIIDYVNQLGLEPYILERYCEIFLQVPDMYVGMILGKNGRDLAEIKHCSGAKIDISKKGEFVPGTLERLVTVSGNIISVHIAHARLIKRLAELESSASVTPAQQHPQQHADGFLKQQHM